MNIAYITDQILPRTAADTKQMVAMASALGDAGVSVTLVTPRRWFSTAPNGGEIAAFYEVPLSFSVRAVGSVFPNIRGVEKIAQGLVGPLIEVSREADIVYTRTLPIVAGALLMSDRPVVYETYRPWPAQRPASRSFFRWLGRHPRFLGAVLHSDFARDSYLECGVPPEKLLTAYNGYRPDHLVPVLSREEARAQCGLPAGGRIVTYAGRIERTKGIETILALANDFPDVTFLLVGSESQGRLERSAEVHPNVLVFPWQTERQLAPYLYAADVLIIPPTSRPLIEVGNTVLPIKTFQYLAAGRAILAPATPDVTELLIDGKNAALVPPDDAHAAGRRLEALLKDDAEMEMLGRGGRDTARDLSWERRADRVLAYIRDRLTSW